jgi:hypothetical protein
MERRPVRVLRFTFTQVQAARRMKRSQALKETGLNPRASVEATMWSMQAPLPRGRVPYRGQVRVTMYAIATAMMVNVRRIASTAFEDPKNKGNRASSRPYGAVRASRRLPSACRTILERFGLSAHKTRRSPCADPGTA